MGKLLLLFASHLALAAFGFLAGIYALPILTAPAGPPLEELRTRSEVATYSGEFRRDLQGSDVLHWGEGWVAVSETHITLMGRLAPGPDYRLYLSPTFVETEGQFERLRASMVQVGEVKTFENFVVEIPAGLDPSRFNSVIVWCEAFGQFITAARYR